MFGNGVRSGADSGGLSALWEVVLRQQPTKGWPGADVAHYVSR